jgi:hypothetical protein
MMRPREGAPNAVRDPAADQAARVALRASPPNTGVDRVG